MCAQLRSRSAELDFPPVRALHSLTENDVAALAVGLGNQLGTWLLERHDGYDGHLSLLLLPTDSAPDPEFSLSRDRAGLQLCAWQGEEHTELGVFANVRAVALAVLAAVAKARSVAGTLAAA